jgi:hypothetical protein
MPTGTVYRAVERNAHGDPVDENGNVYRLGANSALPEGIPITLGQHGLVGQLEIVFGGQTVQSVRTRGEVASTEGMIGARRSDPVQLQHGDRLVVGGVTHAVAGPPLWDCPSTLTGTDFGWRWHRIEATI